VNETCGPDACRDAVNVATSTQTTYDTNSQACQANCDPSSEEYLACVNKCNCAGIDTAIDMWEAASEPCKDDILFKDLVSAGIDVLKLVNESCAQVESADDKPAGSKFIV